MHTQEHSGWGPDGRWNTPEEGVSRARNEGKKRITIPLMKDKRKNRGVWKKGPWKRRGISRLGEYPFGNWDPRQAGEKSGH